VLLSAALALLSALVARLLIGRQRAPIPSRQ
jgi:hypothetical protein